MTVPSAPARPKNFTRGPSKALAADRISRTMSATVTAPSPLRSKGKQSAPGLNKTRATAETHSSPGCHWHSTFSAPARTVAHRTPTKASPSAAHLTLFRHARGPAVFLVTGAVYRFAVQVGQLVLL